MQIIHGNCDRIAELDLSSLLVETELADTQQALHETQQRMHILSQHHNAVCAQLDQQQAKAEVSTA